MNIHAHFSAIPERLAIGLAFALKVADFIRIQKNGYHALTAGSLPLLLVADARYISEAIMLSGTMTDCGLKP